MNATAIIKALRQRMEQAGYVVHLGQHVDPAQDRVPLVTIQVAAGGIKAVSERPNKMRSLQVMVEYVFRTKTADPLIEVMDAVEQFHRDLIQTDPIKRADQLEGRAFKMDLEKTWPMLYPERTDLGLIQTILNISYVEK